MLERAGKHELDSAMRTSSNPAATVVVLNPAQIAQVTKSAETGAYTGGGLDLINAGGLPEAELAALGLTTGVNSTGPANRPDPVDVISFGGRDLAVDRISRNAPQPPVFRGGEVNLVA